ncbi:hypothetical protein HPGCJGGD_0166 [Methylobacterium haplocladii]|nr:hypothetical protein HPGCJGGD_0166 [Methylobacterium haplocladii]
MPGLRSESPPEISGGRHERPIGPSTTEKTGKPAHRATTTEGGEAADLGKWPGSEGGRMGPEDRKPSTAPNARGPPSVSEREPATRHGRRAKGGTDEAAQLRRQTARTVALGARATTPSRGQPRGVLIGRTKDRRAFEEGGVKAATTGRRKPGRWPRARGPPTTEGGSSCPRSRPDDQTSERRDRRSRSTSATDGKNGGPGRKGHHAIQGTPARGSS